MNCDKANEVAVIENAQGFNEAGLSCTGCAEKSLAKMRFSLELWSFYLMIHQSIKLSWIVHDLSISIIHLQKLLNMGLLFSNRKVEYSEFVLVGQSLDNITALNHSCLGCSPKSGVYYGGTVASKGSPNGNISDSGGSSSLEDDCCCGKEYAEECCVGPKGNLVTKSVVSRLR